MVTKHQKSMGRKNIMYRGPETECPGKEQRTGQQAELWLAWGMMALHNMSRGRPGSECASRLHI